MMRRSIYIIGIGVAGLLAACSSDDQQLGTVTASETITVTATVGLPQPADTRLVLTNDYTAQGGNTLTAVWSGASESFTVWKKDAAAGNDGSVTTYTFGDCKPYADAHYAKFTGSFPPNTSDGDKFYAIYPANTPVKASNTVTLDVSNQTGKLNENDKVYMYTSGQYNKKGASLELQEFKYLTAIIKVRLKFKTETEVGAEDYKYGGDITKPETETRAELGTISNVKFTGTGLLSQATVSLDNPTSYTKVDGAAEEISFGNQSFQLEKNYNEDGNAGNGVTTVSATVYLHVIPGQISNLTVYATKDGRTYKHTWTQTFNLTAGYFYYDNDDDNVSEPAWTVELVEEEPTTPAEESTLGMVDARATAEITQTRLYFGGEKDGWEQVLWNRSGEALSMISLDYDNSKGTYSNPTKTTFTQEVGANAETNDDSSAKDYQEKATFIGQVRKGTNAWFAFYPVSVMDGLESIDITKVPLDISTQAGTIYASGDDRHGLHTIQGDDINLTYMYAVGKKITHNETGGDGSVELGLEFKHLTSIIEVKMMFNGEEAKETQGNYTQLFARYVTFEATNGLFTQPTVNLTKDGYLTEVENLTDKNKIVITPSYFPVVNESSTLPSARSTIDTSEYTYSTTVYLHVFPNEEINALKVSCKLGAGGEKTGGTSRNTTDDDTETEEDKTSTHSADLWTGNQKIEVGKYYKITVYMVNPNWTPKQS